jgi:outer membrane biosynthesis protein TonB
MIKPIHNEGSFIWFLALALALNAGAVLTGYWFPTPAEPGIILLTDVDISDVPPKGDPEAEQEQPPQPEPTPPPEDEPTPPPLDKPPEFEIPAPSATPIPSPQSRPKPSPKPVKQPSPSNPNPAATPGANKGIANGVKAGTGKGGHSGLFIQRPNPPYPGVAVQMMVSGNVTVVITVSSGQIVGARGNGPAILANAAVRWIRANWVPAPTTSGTYELPIQFQMN